MLNKFVCLEEFRQLPSFKVSHPFLRKAVINIGKSFPETLFMVPSERDDINKGVYFRNAFINSNVKNHPYEARIITGPQDYCITNVLERIIPYNWCIASYVNENSLCRLSRFTFKKSERVPEFVYHVSDVGPDVILKEGIHRKYSLNYAKPFPPLVFVGTEPCWYGKWVYKIKTNQDFFIDTNMDWRCLDKRPYLCVKNSISPEEIVDSFLKPECSEL